MKIGPLRDYVFKKAKETVMKKTLGLYPAPLEIIKVIMPTSLSVITVRKSIVYNINTIMFFKTEPQVWKFSLSVGRYILSVIIF